MTVPAFRVKKYPATFEPDHLFINAPTKKKHLKVFGKIFLFKTGIIITSYFFVRNNFILI